MSRPRKTDPASQAEVPAEPASPTPEEPAREPAETYEPPRLMKFDKLEKLIVSGE